MVDFQRLTRAFAWLVLGCVLGALPLLAFADDYSAKPQYRWQGQSAWQDSEAAAADAYVSVNPYPCGSGAPFITWSFSNAGVVHTWPNSMGSAGTYAKCTSGTIFRTWANMSRQFVCLYGGTLSGTQCVGAPACPEGETRDATGQCQPPPEPECGNGYWAEGAQSCVCDAGWGKDTEGACTLDNCESQQGTKARFATMNASSACFLGCKASREGVEGSSCSPTGFDANGQPTLWVCDMAYDGTHCTPGVGENTGEPEEGQEGPEPEIGPEAGQPEGCPSGFVSGQINGQDVCVQQPAPTDEKTTNETTTTNPDGTKTTVKTERSTAIGPDGSVQETITTTTTEKDDQGNVTGQSTTTTGTGGGLSGFCQANPTSALCGQGGGKFAGTCDAAPECTGDAIQCAIAMATFRTECVVAVSQDVRDAWDGIKTGTFDGEGEGLDRRTVQVPESLDVMLSGGGPGLVDQSFNVMGKTITLPFSVINDFLEMIGVAMLMIAWIRAYQIVSGAM